MHTVSLYLHIPFCSHRCSYCDFNTYTSLGNLKASYTQALCQEIEQVGELAVVAKGSRLPIGTIFLGGGTPSLMTPDMLNEILTAVQHAFVLSPDAEISMEANPGTVDESYLKAVRQIGINRLSFGVQSAIDSELTLLERTHDFETVIEAIGMARVADFDNFNLDLIYGVPGQTIASWRQSVAAVLALKPTHLSLYCLTIEPGTSMHRWLKNGRISPPDPDLAADQYELASKMMAEAGFVHYEISNWALPSWECQHNLTYWRNQDYLGLGAGAHGQAAGYRYEVVKQPRVYIRRLAQKQSSHYPLSGAVADYHAVDKAEGMADTVITQLRLLQEGLDLTQFQAKFGCSLMDVYADEIKKLLSWGLLQRTDGRLCLTKKGRFLSNQVFYRFM